MRWEIENYSSKTSKISMDISLILLENMKTFHFNFINLLIYESLRVTILKFFGILGTLTLTLTWAKSESESGQFNGVNWRQENTV